MPTYYQPRKLGTDTSKSTLDNRSAPLSPQQRLINLPTSSRVLRCLAATLLLSLLAQKGGQLHLPHTVYFALLVIGFYAGITALTGWDPFHVKNKKATVSTPN